MAILFTPSQRVWSTAGAPVAGGKLRVYESGTTTLSNVFSDEAMQVAMANPVVADSAGWLPAIFADENTYDLQALDASSVAIAGQQWNDWSTIGGSAANTIERTLSGARFKVRGGDIGDGFTGALLEAGSPSPDDTGGYMRHGGWAGTQLDKGITDAAVWDFIQTKSLKEGGKRIPSVLYTDATTFSAASTVDIQLPNTPTGTIAWRVRVWGLALSANTLILARLAYDATPTFKTGGTDYTYSVLYNVPPGSVSLNSSAGGANMGISGPWIADANWLGYGEITVVTVASGSGYTNVSGVWRGGKYDITGAGSYGPQMESFAANGLGSYGRATYLRLYPNAGNITGKYSVEALRGYGE